MTPRVASGPVWGGVSTRFAPLKQDIDTDVCVIGLGASGLAAAEAAALCGARVVGIDAHQIASGAAGANGGFLLAGSAHFYHDAERILGPVRAAELFQITLDEIREIARDMPDTAHLSGSLRVAGERDEAADIDMEANALVRAGFDVSEYNGPEGRGLLLPGNGYMNPVLRCEHMATRAVAAGALLFTQTAALQITSNEVVTRAGRIRCRYVLVAVDGLLDYILPELAGRVQTVRLQMLATSPTTDVRLRRPVYSRWGYDYWLQTDDGRIALGGHRLEGGDDEITPSISVSQVVQEGLERLLRERIRSNATVTHRWAASVGYTDTHLPVFGEVRPGMIAFGGYSGLGNVIGPLCGRAAARRLLTGIDDPVWTILGS